MRELVRAIQAVLNDAARRCDLPQTDFLALLRIVAAGGMSGSELGQIFGVRTSSITQLADRLEDRALIRRTRPCRDRRRVILQPTAKGRRQIERTLGPVLARMELIVRDMPDDERSVVARFLETVDQGLADTAPTSTRQTT